MANHLKNQSKDNQIKGMRARIGADRYSLLGLQAFSLVHIALPSLDADRPGGENPIE